MQTNTDSNNNNVEEIKQDTPRAITKHRQYGVDPDKTTSASKLIRDVSQMTGIPKSKVRNVLEAFKVALLHETYEANKKVVLRGFGTFDAREKKAMNNNFTKGKETTSKSKSKPKSYKLKFKCSNLLTYTPDKDY